VLAEYEAAEPAVKDRARLRREVQRLTGELDRARQVIEVQSKLSAVLDSLATDSSRNDSERRSTKRSPSSPRSCGRAPRTPKPQPRAPTGAERTQVLQPLHRQRFVILSPAEVYAILLDGGRYLCSESTMYTRDSKELAQRLRADTIAKHQLDCMTQPG